LGELGGVGADISSGVGSDILLTIILVWSVVVNVVRGGIPILGSLRVDWFVILSGVTSGVGRVGGGVN
jgi:hypothetical protein